MTNGLSYDIIPIQSSDGNDKSPLPGQHEPDTGQPTDCTPSDRRTNASTKSDTRKIVLDKMKLV
nr:MAG TPA: hypothetical protein [Bacteriophage sp.]